MSAEVAAAQLGNLAHDFREYLALRPEARPILQGHADRRGSPESNLALSERRVALVKRFLVERGVPEIATGTGGLGNESALDEAEVRDLIAKDPNLTPDERRSILRNFGPIVVADNRRVEVTFSTTAEQSARFFPHNHPDFDELLGRKFRRPRKTTKKQ